MDAAADTDAPSPLLPLIWGAGLAVTLAAILVRVFTTGAGIELHQPGTQLLFDAVALVGVTICVLGRVLERRQPFRSAGWVLPALLVVGVVLVTAASRAPNADLGWRTAATFAALLLLGVTVRELGTDQRVAKLMAAFVVACVGVAAALGIYEYSVEYPALVALYRSGQLDEGLALQSRGFQIAMSERIHSRAAVGPFLLPGMLATAALMALPLAGAALWGVVRGAKRSVWQAGVGALVLAALVLALLLTKSKGAVVTGVGTACVFALLHPRAAPYRRRLLIGGAIAGGLVVGVGFVVYLINPEGYGIGLSFQVRIEYWRTGLAMWADAPLLGNGLNGYRELYSFYKPVRAEETLHAHNAAVQLLAETGLVGLLAFIGLAIAWVREGIRGLDAEPARAGVNPAPTGRAPAGDGSASDGSPPASDGSPPAPPSLLLGSTALGVACAFGWFLGLLLLAGYGDRYSVQEDTLGHFVGIALGVPAVAFCIWRCLERVESAPLLGAAALAGATALVWDGFLNFGMHQAGVFALACVLGGLAPALGQAPERAFGPPALRVGAAIVVGGLTAWLLAGRVPSALQADVYRDRARVRHAEAARLINGADLAGLPMLDDAVADYDAAAEAYPGNVRTWLERAGALDALGRGRPAERDALHARAVASVEQAIALDPWAADAQNELGRLLLSSDLPRAVVAFDEAVRLYPSHPAYLLHAGEARERLTRTSLPEVERRQVADQARQLLTRALDVSEETRLVRLKLDDAQRLKIARLLATLESR